MNYSSPNIARKLLTDSNPESFKLFVMSLGQSQIQEGQAKKISCIYEINFESLNYFRGKTLVFALSYANTNNMLAM